MDNEENVNNTTAAETNEAQPEPAETETPCDLGQEIQSLEAQLDEMKDKYLRSLAEMENMKKRLHRERDNIVKYSTESLIKDFLRIYDAIEKSIQMALELHPEDSKFIDGNRMVEKLFLETLKRHNVEPIEAKGMPFDPQYHEAMLHVDRDDILIPGLVVDELEKGFMLHDRVLRPSRVTVSKAREKTTKEE
ncbi:MAG: nucleotide exchange factor GrpE [Syntrophaceae bacterium]